MARDNDPVCLVCGRRCPGCEVLYVRPNGNTHQAVALCGKRCRRAYDGPAEPLAAVEEDSELRGRPGGGQGQRS